MQKVIVGVVVVWLLVAAGRISPVYSQPAALTEAGQTSTMRLGRDLSLTFGFDLWPNQWQTTTLSSTSITLSPTTMQRGGHIESSTAFGVGLIPTATLVWRSFFISASYMWTPDYDFGTSAAFNVAQDGVSATVNQMKTTASRQEGDLTVGYFPLNWLGVAIGYKGVFQDYKNKSSTIFPPNLITPEMSSSFKACYNGVVFGVLGSARIDDRFTLIGNVFGGYMTTSCSPDCPQFSNGSYAASKIVLRYTPLPPLALTLGYRVQIINTSLSAATNVSGHGIDLTHGPVIGVNYRF